MLLWQGFLQLCDERGELVRHSIPEDIVVHVHVIVDDSVAHSDNGLPGYSRVCLAELGRNVAGRFSDGLDEVRQGQAQDLVAVVGLGGLCLW